MSVEIETTLLNFEQIRLDGGTQPRAELQQDVILEYREAMAAGRPFPPPTVYWDGEEYWLADGFHRVAAAMRLDINRRIACEVRQGTLQDAQWFSYSANQGHGLRRSNEDKRRAVIAALSHQNGANLSDRNIAEHCGVDHKTVARHRTELRPTGEIPQSRTGRDGRTINTARIGSSQESRSPKPRKKYGGISPKAFKPVRGLSDPIPMTPLSMPPGNPEMGARTLISIFDANYLRVIIEVLSQHLSQQGTES